VTRVRANWKAHEAPVDGWTHELGRVTVIYGDNAAGKSRVPEAVEWCLRGALSNFAGRQDVRDARQHWRAKPEDAKTLWAEVVLSSGNVIRREQSRANGAVSVTVDSTEVKVEKRGGDPVLPVTVALGVRDVREHLFGSPKAAESWLAAQMGVTPGLVLEAALNAVTNDGALTPEEKENLRGVLRTVGLNASTPDVLQDRLEAQAKDARAEVAAATAVQQDLVEAVGPPVTDDALNTAQAAVQKAQHQLDGIRTAAKMVEELRGIGARLVELRTAYTALPPVDGNAVQVAATARDVIALIDRMEQALGGFVEGRNATCPCCEGVAAERDLAARRVRLQRQIHAAAAAATAADQRKAVVEEGTTLRARGQEIMAQLGGLAPIVTAPTWQPAAAEAAGVEALGTATAALDELQRRRVGTAAPGMAEKRAVAAQARANRFAAAAKVMQKALTTVVGAREAMFNDRVSLYLPAWIGRARIAFRPTVTLDIEAPDGTPRLPTDAQEACLMLAIARALAPTTGLVLMVGEDRDYDPRAVATLVQKFSDAEPVGQVIITTTRQPASVPNVTAIQLSQSSPAVPIADAVEAPVTPSPAVPVVEAFDQGLADFLAGLGLPSNGNPA
jgi:hypothetical protein